MQQALGLEHAIVEADTTDGLRVTLTNGDIVHLRPSGNAPELRCYVESLSDERAAERVADTLRGLQNNRNA